MFLIGQMKTENRSWDMVKLRSLATVAGQFQRSGGEGNLAAGAPERMGSRTWGRMAHSPVTLFCDHEEQKHGTSKGGWGQECVFYDESNCIMITDGQK